MRNLCSLAVLLVFLTVQAIPAESYSTFQAVNPNLIKINDPVLSESGYRPHYASQSSLAGIGIRSSLQAGLTDGFKPDVLWNSLVDGALRGAMNLGMEFAGQALGLDPLIAALAFRTLEAAIEGVLEYKGDIFRGIGEAANTFVKDFFNLGVSGNDPWSQAAYLNAVLDFSRIVQEQGLVAALETYATAIFTQETIQGIVGQGGIFDMVTNRAVVMDNEDGIRVKRIYTDNTF